MYIYYSHIVNNNQSYLYIIFINRFDFKTSHLTKAVQINKNILQSLNGIGWKDIIRPVNNYEKDNFLFDFRSIKNYKNIVKNIKICYKKEPYSEENLNTLLNEVKGIIANISEEGIYINLTNLSLNQYSSYGHQVKNNLDILLTSVINNLIFDETIQESKLVYFTFNIKNNIHYIFYGNIDYLKKCLTSNTIHFKQHKFLDYNGILEYIEVEIDNQKDNIIDEIIFKESIVKSNYDRFHTRILKYLSETNSINIKSLVNQYPNKKYRDDIIDIDFKIEDTTISVTMKVPNNPISILYPFERKVYFWNDNNRLITGNLESENTWRKRMIVNNDKKNSYYKYTLHSPNSIIHFTQFLIAFGINTPRNPFINKKKLLHGIFEDKLNNNDKLTSLFYRVGYNSEGLVVINDNGGHWVELLQIGFKFDPEYNWWYKFPINLKEPIELNRLGINEAPKSLQRYIKGIELNDVFVRNSTTAIGYNSQVSIIDTDILDELRKISDDMAISMYFDSNYKDMEEFSGSQLNYYDNIKSLWIGYKSSDKRFKTINIPWEYIINENEIKSKVVHILNHNEKTCYNIKALLVQLLKYNIEFNYETFKHDVMLASWIYNPVFNEKRSDWNDRSFFPCQNRYSYNLQNIYNQFTNNIIDISKYTETQRNQIIYSVYPLILTPIIIPLIESLNLLEAYSLELDVTKVSAKIENRGINVNKSQLRKISDCLTNNMTNNYTNIITLGEKIGVNVTQFLNITTETIEYKHDNFYEQLYNTFIESNIFEEPYTQIKTKNGSRDYIQAFIVKNNNRINLIDNIEFKKFITLLLTLLKYSYVYRIQLPKLVDIIDNNNEIHPCINTIGKPGGRFDTTLPRFHWMPNPDKTIWGKFIRRSIQSRPGYKFIIIDWSAQELITIGLLSKDKSYIKSINSGDQHVVTGIKLFKEQIVLRDSVYFTDDTVCFKIDGNIGHGESNILYISNGSIFYKPQYNINKEGFVEITDKEEVYNIFKNESIFDNYICISKSQRHIAKNLSFGLMYGMRESTFRQQLQTKKKEMEHLINLWWEAYPGIKRFIKDVYYDTFWKGHASTYFGKRCFFPQFLFYKERLYDNEITNGLMSESVISYVNSGTAADWLKKSMVLIDKSFINDKIDGHIIHTMHDEIVLEVHESNIEQATRIAVDIMEKHAIPEFEELGIKVNTTVDVCPWWESCDEIDITNDITDLIDYESDAICNP